MGDLPRVRDPADEGMIPVFDLTNSFLNSLASWTWADLIKDYNIEVAEDFDEDFLKEWPDWMWWGFAICLVLGVVFMLIMPVCGCFYCCCRCCCGCCQAQEKVRKGGEPPSGCKSLTCGIILFVIAAGMLSASLVAVAALPMLKTEMGPDGAFHDVIKSLRTVNKYINDTVVDLEVAVFPPFEDTKNDVFKILDELPTSAVEDLAKETGVDPALNDLYHYTQSLPDLQANLTEMNTSKADLETLRGELDTELNTSRSDIGTLLNACPGDITSECTDLDKDLHKLISWAVYNNLSDTSAAATAIDYAIEGGLIDEVDKFVKEFQSISTDIENEIGAEINSTKDTINEAEQAIHDKYKNISKEITSYNFDDIIKTIEDDIEPYVEDYYIYVHWFLLLFTIIAFVTSLLYLLGIPLGWFCGSGGAGHGANLILAGISFTFIFSFFFWILTVVFLAAGGGLQLTTCRHLTTYDESMQAIEKLARNTYKQNEIEAGSEPINYNLTIRELLDSCDQNTALYTAFNLADNGYDVTELLDLNSTDLKEQLDKLANITFDIGTIEIITEEVNNSVIAIEAATDLIVFADYYTELNKDITKTDLLEYADQLRDLAGKTSDNTFAKALTDEADELELIHNDHVVPMIPERDNLRKATTSSDTIVNSVSLSKTMYDLTMAQYELNNNVDKIVSDIVKENTDEIYGLLDHFTQSLTRSIEEDIGGCRPVYDSLATVVQAPCVYVLDPFNVLWFCFGWFMSFGILAIIFGTKVVGIFRSKAVYSKTSPADKVSYEAYPMVTYK